MTELMQQIIARKVERRRQLAALPVGEKLGMLEQMIAAANVISATGPAKPISPSGQENWHKITSGGPPMPTAEASWKSVACSEAGNEPRSLEWQKLQSGFKNADCQGQCRSSS